MILYVVSFFYLDSYIFSYVVYDLVMWQVVVIDLVLDYDLDIDVFGVGLLQLLFVYVCEYGLQVCWLLEIYVYVDYISVGCWFKLYWLQVMLVMGQGIVQVQ